MVGIRQVARVADARPRQLVQRTVGRDRIVARIERSAGPGAPVVLRGPRGIGRTRVLAELAERHAGPVAWVRPDEPDTVDLILASVDTSEEDEPTLVLVDDAHDLATSSIPAVRRAARCDGLVVVAAVSTDTGSVTPAWWERPGWRVVELGPLRRRALAEVLTDLLGAPPAASLVRSVWEASGGAPAPALEVLANARDRGILQLAGDHWVATEALPTVRLARWLHGAFDGLSPAALEALQLLALASPLPIPAAARLFSTRAARELQERGLVRYPACGEGSMVAIAGPVHATVVASWLDAARRRTALAALVDVLDDTTCGNARDRWLVAACLETGRGVDPERGYRVARAAYRAGELHVAQQLLDGMRDQGTGGAPAAGLAGLVAAQRPWIRPRAVVDTSGPTVADALILAHRRAIADGDPAAAIDGLQRATTHDGPAARRAQAYAAAVAASTGDPARGQALIPADPDRLELDARCCVTVVEGLVAAAGGGAEQVMEVLERLEEEPAVPDALLPMVEQLRGLAVLIDDERRLSERIATAADEVEGSLRHGDADLAWWLLIEGRLHSEAGAFDAAQRCLSDAADAAIDADPLRIRPLALAEVALLAAITGATDDASQLLDQAREVPTTAPAVRDRVDLVDELVAAAREQRSPTGLIGLGERLFDRGEAALAAVVLSLPARRDTPATMRRAAATAVEGRAWPVGSASLVAAIAAAGRDDATELEAAARALAAQGRRALAAELLCTASAIEGSQRPRVLAAALVAGCHGRRTPELATLPAVELSPRRLATALLAMDGADGRAIAATLDLSIRTVENHLAHVYRTLGVSGRDELRRLFDRSLAPFSAG